MAPFQKLGAVSYSHSVAPMAVSFAVYEIFSVKKFVTFKTGLGIVQSH